MVATVFQNGRKSYRVSDLPHQQAAQTHRQKVKDLLPNRIVAYSPDLARAVGGATTGLYLSQLLFQSDKGHDPNGWVYKSEAEMSRETGLTKREQQTARRKLLSLGVIQIVRQGFKFTYHFRIVWERLYQVITGSQRTQTVPTEKGERTQTVSTEPVQTVPTQPPECLQNVHTKRLQTVATPDTHRENNRENRKTENTDQKENQETWEKTVEQVKQDLPIGETADRLAGTGLLEVTETKAVIFVPNRNTAAWLERRLYRQIAKAVKAVVGKELDLQFIAAS